MSGVILSKKANKLIPDTLVNKIVAAFPSSIGAAAVEGGEIKVLHSDEGADKETFKLVQSDYTDTEVLFFLSKDKGKRTQLDLQPYVLLKNAEGKPLLSVFLSGSFPSFEHTNATNSVEWYVVEQDLLPRIRDTFDLCGSDIAKTMERIMTSQLLQKDILNLIGDKGGVISFIASNGLVHSFERNNKTLTADWGWTSDALDYVENVHELETAPNKSFGLTSFRRKVAQVISPDKPATTPPADAPAAPPAETPGRKAAPTPPTTGRKAATAPAAPATTPPAEPPVEPKKETEPSVLIPKEETELTEEELYYQAPADIVGNARLQAVYRRECGFLPDDYKDRPKTKRSNTKLKRMKKEKEEAARKAAAVTLKSFQDLGKLPAPATSTAIPASSTGRKAAAAAPSSPTGKETEYPDTTTHHIPNEEIDVGILSAAQKKGLGDFLSDAKVIKQIDKHSKLVVDPTKLQEFEAKRPSFTDLSGLEMDDMINWPPQTILWLITDHPEAAERLITQAVYERHHMQQLLNRKEEAKETIPTSVPSTRKAAEPAKPASSGRRAAM
jgi:hypothetical protein